MGYSGTVDACEETISTTNAPVALPDELRDLGEMRQLFESSERSLLATYGRGLFPMAFATLMIVVGEAFLVPRDWKYYLVVVIAVSMFLNGLRVLVKAWRRRRQKVAIFEDGFALWRYDYLTTYRWDQVETVDVSPEFFGFAVWCRLDDGTLKKIKFEPSTDPISNLLDLWRALEEESSRQRIPAAVAALDKDEELWFARKVWGTIVDTRIGVNRYGIRWQPRYGKMFFVDWSLVESVQMKDGELVIKEKGDDDRWFSMSERSLPDYVTLVAAAEHARKNYLGLVEELGKERIPAAHADLDNGQELVFGEISVSLRGIRYEGEFCEWAHVDSVGMEYDHLAVRAWGFPGQLRLGAVDLPNRVVLLAAVEYARDKCRSLPESAEPDDEDEHD